MELLDLLNLQRETRRHSSDKIEHFLVNLHELSTGLVPSKMNEATRRISLLRVFLRFGEIEGLVLVDLLSRHGSALHSILELLLQLVHLRSAIETIGSKRNVRNTVNDNCSQQTAQHSFA